MNISDIYQGDSNDTIESDDPNNSDTSDSDTIYDTDDEIDNEPVVVNLSPIPDQTFVPGQPVKMKVNMSNNQQSSYLPLCMMLNARSIYNKCDHFKDLYQLGPDLIIASETWERKRKRLTEIIGTSQYKTISYHREGNRVGGGCAIIYNDVRFKVDSLEVEVASGVEAVWALFTPKASTTMSKVKRIAVGRFMSVPGLHIKLPLLIISLKLYTCSDLDMIMRLIFSSVATSTGWISAASWTPMGH